MSNKMYVHRLMGVDTMHADLSLHINTHQGKITSYKAQPSRQQMSVSFFLSHPSACAMGHEAMVARMETKLR